MMKEIKLDQHIISSSKVRKGFRTYQRTLAAIDDELDKKISSYGVYRSTLYEDIASVAIEEYPDLFLFHRLNDHQYIICHTQYVGLDLHSFPPRMGNYLAHTFLIDKNPLFNPVELYYEDIWKQPENIKEEDDINNPVPFDLAPLTVRVDPNYFDPSAMSKLVAFPKRVTMLRKAIEVILMGQHKLIIIDERDYLVDWVLTLLQVFPLPFVFERMSIASLGNANVITDVCNVFCLERENREVADRQTEKTYILDINATTKLTKSDYANAAVDAIKQEKFGEFRKTIFPELTNVSGNLPDKYNLQGIFFTKLLNVSEMDLNSFRSFFKQFYADQPDKVDAVYASIMKNRDIEKCRIIWDTMYESKLHLYGLTDHQKAALYTFSPDTDNEWLDYDCNLAKKLNFSSLEQLYEFYRVNNESSSPERNHTYFYQGLSLIDRLQNVGDKIEALNELENKYGPLSGEELNKQANRKTYLDFLHRLSKLEGVAQVEAFLNAKSKFTAAQINEGLVRYFPSVNWKTIVALIENKQFGVLKKIYDLEGYSIKLPSRKMMEGLLKFDADNSSEFINSIDSREIKDLLKATNNESIKRVYAENLKIDSIYNLEQLLGKYSGILNTKILVERFLNRCGNEEVWKAVQVLYGSQNSNSDYRNLNEIGNNEKRLFLDYVNQSSESIPNQYLKLAYQLENRKLLTRDLPRTELVVSDHALRSVGALTDFPKISKLVKKGKLDQQALLDLIKLPWEYYTWRTLYDVLDKVDRDKIPTLLGSILSRLHVDDLPLAAATYKGIVREYIVYLIVDDKLKILAETLSGPTRITWKSYDFIKLRLHSLIDCSSEENKTLSVFLHPINDGIINRTRGKDPAWRFEAILNE